MTVHTVSTRYHATFCDRRPWLYRAAVHAIRPNPCWLRRRGRAWPLPRSAVGGFERSSQVFTQYFEPFRADHTFTLVVLIVLWHRGPGVELAAISRGRLVPTLGYEPGCGVLYSPGGRWKRVICTRPQRCVPLYPSSAWRNVGVVSPRPAHGPARTFAWVVAEPRQQTAHAALARASLRRPAAARWIATATRPLLFSIWIDRRQGGRP